MTNKFSARSLPIISRDNGSVSRSDTVPNWLSEFAQQIDKQSVKSKSESYSLYDQINQILGNKTRYSSVQEAVDDMKARTGLSEYLKQIKQAAEDASKESVFTKIPELKTFIDNYIDARPGTSIEAVVHDALKLNSVRENLPQNDELPEEIRRYINDKITEKRMNAPSHMSENFQLGQVDLKSDQNTVRDNDPFAGCEPARNGK